MWVSPFRHLRINGYLLLPAAFRSLSRLSSALSAKASTLRSFLLDLFEVLTSFVSIALETFGSQSQIAFFVYIYCKSFDLFFSDVLIKILSYSKSLLYEVFKVQFFSTETLSVIRNLNLLKPLITGKTSSI